MKRIITVILVACFALSAAACGEAMDEPIEPETRAGQQLDLKNAKIERTRKTVTRCPDCTKVIILKQSSGDDDDSSGDNLRYERGEVRKTATAFDGDPVPWPLDEKRED